jgi:hypothetical protein
VRILPFLEFRTFFLKIAKSFKNSLFELFFGIIADVILKELVRKKLDFIVRNYLSSIISKVMKWVIEGFIIDMLISIFY